MHTRNMWEYQEASVRAYAMDHELSVRTKAAERYLLGELPPEEREAFEEHFFECAECGEEVRIGQELADNVAAVFRGQSSPHTTTARKKKRRDWVAWIRPIMMGQAAACMDHETSIRTQAAEQYLLGDLRPSEREAFEEHFFECSTCAEDVRLGFQFSENAKAVFGQDPHRVCEPTRPTTRRDWFVWFRPAILVPIAAGLAIVALTGYQNAVQIPALRARLGQLQKPQIVSSMILAPSSRSSVPSISPAAQFFELSLAIGAIAPSERYQCELRSVPRKLISMIPVSKLEPDSNLTLLIPTADLPPGYYEAVLVGVTGGTAVDLNHYPFAVRRE